MKRVIVYNGGNWNGNANNGLFYINVNNTSSNTNTNNGGRLASDMARRQNPKGLCPVHFIWDGHPSFRLCRNGKDKLNGAASKHTMLNVAPVFQRRGHAKNI